MPKIVFIINTKDECLKGLENEGLYDLFGLPDVIPVRNPTYSERHYEDDDDTDEEFESKALVMGPHSSTIEFILDHLLRHGMDYVDPSTFQKRLKPFAKKEKILNLYDEVFNKIYGKVNSTNYNIGRHSEKDMGGHVNIPVNDEIPVAIPVEDEIPVAEKVDAMSRLLSKYY